MKYRVENQLDLFEFHDAVFSLIGFDKNKLIISAKHLNIHKSASENPHDCDMEIDFAKLFFAKFKVVSFEPMRAYQVDDEGNWYTNDPQIIYNGEDAEKHFLNAIKKGITINCIDIYQKENKTYIKLSTCARACFFAMVAFNNVVVEWDDYLKKAWYELHKQYIRKGDLISPAGEEETEIHIIHHEEDTYYQGKLEKGPTVSVGVKYKEEQLWGHGKEYNWEDAFANVQKQLPDGILLKCCMTCRYGNMCPYGTKPGEIFCTKDLPINSKEDICNLFDNHEMFERAKNVADSCDKYRRQSNDYYTYNSYLYFLTNN